MPPTAEETARQILAIMRARAFARLVQAAHVTGDFMCEVLKGVVSGQSPGHRPGPASVTPFLYVDRSGRMRRRRGEGEYRRGQPPGVVTGAGMQSIKYQIREQDLVAGRVLLWIGVDASAPGGTYLQSYMLAHDLGIRYPTRGPLKGTGPVIQHPWLRVTVHRYKAPMAQLIVGVTRGLM